MSESVRASLAAQQQTCDFPDVVVRFCIERPPEQQQREADDGVPRPRSFVGNPFPAHRLILSSGSTFLETRLKRSCWQASGPRAGATGSDRDDEQAAKRRRVDREPQHMLGDAGDERGTAVSALPEVLVPLSSEAEVPFARQAIEYMYRGSLGADLDVEALLRVRQQACYLGVKGCPQACDNAMVAWLRQQQVGAGPSSSGAAAEPRVLQAYACLALFPEPGTSPDVASFDPVRSALAKQLVSHFGDAVAVCNRQDLYRQLLQLPALALRELLAADNFGTDSEDSVFLLLAYLLEAHKGLPVGTRAELCGLVRLHRLSSTYLYHVLPAFQPFTISREELGFLLHYAAASEQGKDELLACDDKRRGSPWYCSPPRRQVVPAGGCTVTWSISREQLEQGLRKMLEGGRVVYDFVHTVCLRGVSWTVEALLSPMAPAVSGAPAVGFMSAVYLKCGSPTVFGPSWTLGPVQGVFAISARLAVHRWDGAQREEVWLRLPEKSGRGWVPCGGRMLVAGRSLPLRPATAPAGAGGGGGAAAGPIEAQVAALVARLSHLMHEGRISGVIQFPRP